MCVCICVPAEAPAVLSGSFILCMNLNICSASPSNLPLRMFSFSCLCFQIFQPCLWRQGYIHRGVLSFSQILQVLDSQSGGADFAL